MPPRPRLGSQIREVFPNVTALLVIAVLMLATGSVHAQDAFNVTEDCDLGIRLQRKGYRVGILDSATMEEPNVDVVNWIELIPFTETRNYVQRVIENVQVYRARLGSPALKIEADLRRGKG